MPGIERDEQFIADLRAVRTNIRDGFSLCDFMGVSEREALVVQTIVAAVNNLDTHGEPYSIRGKGVFTTHGGGLIDNRSAYGYLVDVGYFEEENRGENVVIFPTRKLLDALLRFFKTK